MAIQSFIDYLGTKNIFLQTNLAGDGQADLVYGSVTAGDNCIITQNDFSVNYTAWLKNVVFGSDDFIDYVDSLNLANEADILAKLEAGDFHVELNQNSSTGAPYISELQGLVDFDALFGDSTGTTLKTGKVTQDRFYVSDVNIESEPANSPPTASHIEATATETESEYAGEFGVITNQDLPDDTDPEEIDLLSTASDPDGDPLTVSNIKFYDASNPGVEIAQPSYITIAPDGHTLVVEQNHPDLNELLKDEVLTINVTYDISDGEGGHTIQNTADIEITGTADQYQSTNNVGSDSAEYSNPTAGQNSLTNQVLTLDASDDSDTDPNYVAGSFTYHDGTIKGFSPSSPNLTSSPTENASVTDADNDDWGTPALDPIRDGVTPATQPLDVAGALSDGQVDYTVAFTGQADQGDKVAVTVDYQYDYWYLA